MKSEEDLNVCNITIYYITTDDITFKTIIKKKLAMLKSYHDLKTTFCQMNDVNRVLLTWRYISLRFSCYSLKISTNINFKVTLYSNSSTHRPDEITCVALLLLKKYQSSLCRSAEKSERSSTSYWRYFKWELKKKLHINYAGPILERHFLCYS